MDKHDITPDIAEEILRENGYADEADKFLSEIAGANGGKAPELLEAMKVRALEVLAIEQTQEKIDASWARMAGGGDISLEATRMKKL